MATACAITPRCRRHRGQRLCRREMVRQDGSGAPHRSHRGGVNRNILDQQSGHTGPREGQLSGCSQTAHSGASSAVSSASAPAWVSLCHWMVSRVGDGRGEGSEVEAHGFAPESLERIELSGFGCENMHDAFEIIEEDPLCRRISLDVRCANSA